MFWALLLGVVLLFALSRDWFQSASRYLYFSTEIGLLILSFMLYGETFAKKKWSDPPEPEDKRPRPDGKKTAKLLLFVYGFLIFCVMILWFGWIRSAHLDVAQSLRKAAWFLYWLVFFSSTLFLIWRNLRYVYIRALVFVSIAMTILLTTYEIILLSHGMGWKYTQCILGWVLGAPLDSVLFVYPVAPALVILIYMGMT